MERAWMGFRVTFADRNHQRQQELQQEMQQESLFSKVLKILLGEPKSRREISLELGQKSISGQLNEIIKKLKKNDLINWTFKEKPSSSKQKFQITPKGTIFLMLIEKDT
nr:hypothetical protein [Sunxiuqinia sp.]